MDNQTIGQTTPEELASALVKCGWSTLAAVALRVVVPVGPALGQLLVLAEPLTPLPWRRSLCGLHQILDDPAQTDRLIAALDEPMANVKEERCHPLSS